MRALCHIFGCEMEDREGGCRRCGTWIYDWTFIHREMAWLNPWYKLHLVVRLQQENSSSIRCENENCQFSKLVFFTQNQCCSDECYSNWIPF